MPEPTLSDLELAILTVIARGHPSRNMTVTQRGVSRQVPTLTWDEVALSVGKPTSEILDSIARLGARNYIDHGRQYPSMWGRLRGEDVTHYSWATMEGLSFLNASRKEWQPDPKIETNDIKEVEKFLHELGYNITAYGAGVALATVMSGYSHVEAASHLALATLAYDARDANLDFEKLIPLAAHAAAMVEYLTRWGGAGLIRDEILRNDGSAMIHVSQGDPSWIEAVLKDPLTSKERVANSRIDYGFRSLT